MEEPKLLKDTLNEALATKDLRVEDIAKETGVPERFVLAFIEDNRRALPPAPYTRGYLNKVSKVLELDANEMWLKYEKESNPKKSGKDDMLPLNRYAIKTANKKMAWIIPLAIFLVGYGLINAGKLIAAPSLSIDEPLKELTTAYTPSVVIKGRVDNPKNIVTINGTSIYVDEFGEFKKEFFLDAGINTFEIIAEKFLGRSSKKMIQVIYENPGEKAPEPKPIEINKPNIN